MPVIDFKGEAITFKTTTKAVLDTLEHCADLVAQREESWRSRLEKEIERRKRSENLAKSYFAQLQKARVVHPGPDLEVNKKICNLLSVIYLLERLFIQFNLTTIIQRCFRVDFQIFQH